MNTIPMDYQRAYRANIWKYYLFQFLLSFQLWWPIWVIYLTDERGFSLTQVSVLEALFWLVIIIMQIPTGAIADRFGRKPAMLLGAAFTTLAILVFGLATNYAVVLLSYVAWGVGLTFLSGADAALVYDSLKAVGREHEFQRAAGIGWGLFSLGTLAGMLAGAPLAAVTDLSFPIVVSAGICFLTLIVALTFVEPPMPSEEDRLPYRTLIAESARTAWRLPPVRSMLLLAGLLGASVNATIVFGQPFLSHHNVPVRLFGLAQMPTRLAAMLGALAAYRLTSTFGIRGTLIGAVALTAASYALLGGWDSVFAFGATGAILVANGVMFPATTDYLNRRIPSSLRATILSARQLINSLIIVAFLPVLGTIADRVSLRGVFVVSAAFLAVAGPVALRLWLRADADEQAPERAVAEAEVAAAG